MLSGCPSSWKNRDPNDKGYILEIHIWADGDIKLTNLTIPKGVVTEKDEKASEADSDRRD